MLLFLAKRKICSAILSIFAANPCRYASKSTRNPQSQPSNSAMVDYLVASFGFTPDKAATVSKPISHFNPPEKPEAVRRFLNQHGFSDAQLKTIITLRPNILAASTENTLEPNLCALRDIGLSTSTLCDIGLSTSTLTQIILSAPFVLHLSSAAPSSAAPRIKFWRDFFQGDDTDLVNAFKKNIRLAAYDISRNISPKISLLQSHGLSFHDIRRVVLQAPRLINHSISSLENALKRTKEFGILSESGMFVLFLHAMVRVSREVLQKRMELLKSFGWSEDEFLSALWKAPGMVAQTEETLQAKMSFLIGEANCDPSYIASCPMLLTYSLEKRLRPRLRVLHLLESKGLSGKRRSFGTYIKMSNGEFVKSFILPHKEEISGLHEAYLATCA